jgi:hypothetical protein
MQGQKSRHQHEGCRKQRWLLVGGLVLLLAACTPIQPQSPAAPAQQATPQGEALPITPGPTVNGFTLADILPTSKMLASRSVSLTTPAKSMTIQRLPVADCIIDFANAPLELRLGWAAVAIDNPPTPSDNI